MQYPCLLWNYESITWNHWDSRNSKPRYHLLRAELYFKKHIWKERILSTTSTAKGNETYVASPVNKLKPVTGSLPFGNSLFRTLTEDMHVTDRATFLPAEEQPAKRKCGINWSEGPSDIRWAPSPFSFKPFVCVWAKNKLFILEEKKNSLLVYN